MKNRVLTLSIVFILTTCFVNMASKSSAYEVKSVTVQKIENYGCLDNYVNLTSFAWDMMNVGLGACAQGFQSDPDGWIECNQLVTDSYLAMHAAADAAYDRCKN